MQLLSSFVSLFLNNYLKWQNYILSLQIFLSISFHDCLYILYIITDSLWYCIYINYWYRLYILLKYNGIIYYIIAINYFEVGKTSVTSLLFIKRFLTALIQFLIQVKSNTRLAIIINHLAFCLECALICVKYVQIALQI